MPINLARAEKIGGDYEAFRPKSDLEFGLIEVLNITDIDIHYITSDEQDPGLQYNNKKLKHMLIDHMVIFILI